MHSGSLILVTPFHIPQISIGPLCLQYTLVGNPEFVIDLRKGPDLLPSAYIIVGKVLYLHRHVGPKSTWFTFYLWSDLVST